MHLVPELAPVSDRPVEAELRHPRDAPVEGGPRHHLGKGEVLPAAAHFPYPLVGLAPDALEVIEQRALERPGAVAGSESSLAPLMKRVRHLAIDVDLKLSMGGIADAHRIRPFIAGQPVDFPFHRPALATDAVQYLHLPWRSGGRTHKPVPPRLALPTTEEHTS